MDTSLPTRLVDFTGSWLTQALREAGTISESTVVSSVQQSILGRGEGFVGDIARLELGYRGGAGPASVIAKIPTTVEENRATGQLLGVYEREVRAYSGLVATLDVPVAKVHAALIGGHIDGSAQLDKMKKVDRLPIWLIRRLLTIERGRLEAPPAVLLLEDLSGYEAGDQLAGCGIERAAEVLEVAARLHASSWGPRLPATEHWLQPGDVVPRLFHASYLNARKGFARVAGPHLSPHAMNLFESFRRRGRRLVQSLHTESPRCVLHGDLRLDNLFFSGDGSIRAVIDWQIPNLGPGVLDVAYFLAGSLSPDTPEGQIDNLLAGYHRTLVDHGVAQYSLDRLRADYTKSLLVVLYRFAGVESMDFGDDRGARLIATWLGRLDARLARIPA